MVTRWLITGGCGFIGTNLIKYLVNEGGHFIRVFDNLSVGTREDLGQVATFDEVTENSLNDHQKDVAGCELIVGDILDAKLALKVCEGIDAIVHLAANTGVGPSVQDPSADMESNVIGTFNMLEAARHNNVKKFIFASSGAPIGECTPPIHEELPCHPISPYGASKLAGEAYCSAYYHSFGIETVCLRFGNVYGPGSTHKSSVVAKFIKQAFNGETLEIYGDGTQTRDFIFVSDLIKAVVLSQQNQGVGGEIFQIATNKETTVAEVTDMLVTILKENGVSNFQVINGEKRVGDVQRNFSDTTKAGKQLKWICSNSLKEGLKQTVKYFL